jgi:hypothetical protein
MTTLKTYTSIWEIFERRENQKDVAYCKLCNVKTVCIKTTDGNTSGLHKHASSIHQYKKIDTAKSTKKSTAKKRRMSQPTLEAFFDEDTTEKAVSELIAKDGLTMHQIVKSRLIQKWMKKDNLQPPQSATTATSMLNNYSEKIRDIIMKQITTEKKLGQKFALSFDEWTSAANRNYINIQLYSLNRCMYDVEMGQCSLS